MQASSNRGCYWCRNRVRLNCKKNKDGRVCGAGKFGDVYEEKELLHIKDLRFHGEPYGCNCGWFENPHFVFR
jgi:hypothetical protein